MIRFLYAFFVLEAEVFNMGLLEPITHKEEIERLLNEAQQTYDQSKSQFDNQKKVTTKSLERLGKVKIDAWSDGMNSFVSVFSSFKNIEVNRRIESNLYFIGSDIEPKQMLMNIQNASMTANELARAGVAAVGTGALVGIASYGGAMMFGTASTGTAIAALSGAAKTNATLAWFGGGSKAIGGLGMAGGKLVLAGVAIAPILVVSALITSVKSKERLAEAKHINAEAKNAALQMDIVTTGMKGISNMSDNYSVFIKKLNQKFKPFIKELDRIRKKHQVGEGEQIDFNSLSSVEQKTLHLSWLMAQIYYQSLSVTILTDQGEISNEAKDTLAASKEQLRQIKKDTFRMTGEDAIAADVLWRNSARNMFIVNSIVTILLFYLGTIRMDVNVQSGYIYFVGAIIAFPVMIWFKKIPANKLYFYRIIRLVAALLFVLILHIVI